MQLAILCNLSSAKLVSVGILGTYASYDTIVKGQSLQCPLLMHGPQNVQTTNPVALARFSGLVFPLWVIVSATDGDIGIW